ncbi:LysR family transcriptional regulator [Sphingomonas jatrophae]|uniref:Transcriptional regulator, LysR family n=1 Tax=Sphingomonas jatrophae TaxID=1166337 RepID=A0A1I6KAT0_9SPHN|nr:LysR family transcriptional regulator [Sphingomonas jatrophae]SFR88128.1 transcriptional regulator, LysR family [Sphingomonas jatrophae]
MDQIVAVKAFIGVAELGSFSGAARAQGVSPSLITKQIQALEESLGTTLFQRSTRKVQLTEAGNVYRQHWRKILSDIDTADAAVGAAQREMKGSLRLGAPPAFGRMVVAPLAVGFGRAFPEVAIDLVFTSSQADPLASGIDILFRVGHAGATDAAGVMVRRLASFPLTICASPAYLDAHGTPRTIEDLSAHVCVDRILPGQTGINPWRFTRAGQMVEVPTGGSIRANSADAVISAGVHGQGLIYQPICLVRDDLASGRLRTVTVDAQTMELPLSAQWRTDRHITARLRAFIDHAATQLKAGASTDDPARRA